MKAGPITTSLVVILATVLISIVSAALGIGINIERHPKLFMHVFLLICALTFAAIPAFLFVLFVILWRRKGQPVGSLTGGEKAVVACIIVGSFFAFYMYSVSVSSFE